MTEQEIELSVSEADLTDPGIQAAIRRNERIAAEAMQLIVKRHRKKDPIDAFEHVANTIGILAAEMVRDSFEIGGAPTAAAVSDLIMNHLQRAKDQCQAKKNDP